MQNTFFIGIGGCGTNTINRLIDGNQLLPDNTCCINTAQENLENSKSKTKIAIDEQNVKQAISQIEKQAINFNNIVVIAGLGGYAGSTFLPIIAKALTSKKLNVIVVMTKPFKFEGKERAAMTEKALNEINRVLTKEKILIYENNLILDSADKKQSLPEAFGGLDKNILSDLSAKCL